MIPVLADRHLGGLIGMTTPLHTGEAERPCISLSINIVSN